MKQTKLIDDLDKTSEATETIKYSMDGKDYEIDLTEENAQRFRDALKEFIDASTELEPAPALTLTPARRTRRQSSGASGRDDIAQVREWAAEQGMEVAPRGRIKKEILDAYDEAHGT